MRDDEAFVAWALVEFLGGPRVASASDGLDPPDFYLTIGPSRVGVEVTQLSQFTLEPDGTLGNRLTQDSFAERLVDDLNKRIGPSLPDGVSLLIGLWVPVANAARFRKLLTAWVADLAKIAKKDLKQEQEFDGERVSISVIPERPSGKKIVGFVVNTNSSADIGFNARLILENSIRKKNTICEKVPKPVWLAVLNDYWLADRDTYAAAARKIRVAHCFERIYLISNDGAVNRLTLGA